MSFHKPDGIVDVWFIPGKNTFECLYHDTVFISKDVDDLEWDVETEYMLTQLVYA